MVKYPKSLKAPWSGGYMLTSRDTGTWKIRNADGIVVASGKSWSADAYSGMSSAVRAVQRLKLLQATTNREELQ